MSLAAFPKHDAYKPSGHEWVGDVPYHWSVEKLGSTLKAMTEKNRPDLPLLSITRELGVIERDIEDQDSNHNYIPDDLSGYKVLREGQFGMNKMKAWQGSYGVSLHTGIVSPAYFIFDFTREVDPAFFNRAIRSKLYVAYFGSASDGVRIGQWDLNKTRMREIPVLLPPLEEQRAIASFLDDKCEKIDEAVRIKEAQIALLRERRQILIQEAVTRGLNPDAPMKDSGIDWIGQIPAHWELKRLKHLLKERNERSKTGEEPLLMVSQVHGLVVRADFHSKAEVSASNIDNKTVHENDLVFNKLKAHLGVFFKSTIEDVGIVSPDYAVYTPSGGIADSKFFELLFRHPSYIAQFIVRATGIVEGLIRLYTSDLFDIHVAVPPEKEQSEIITYADDVSDKLNRTITLKQDQISALKEYKTSLINAAVTGKIKVI